MWNIDNSFKFILHRFTYLTFNIVINALKEQTTVIVLIGSGHLFILRYYLYHIVHLEIYTHRYIFSQIILNITTGHRHLCMS